MSRNEYGKMKWFWERVIWNLDWLTYLKRILKIIFIFFKKTFVITISKNAFDSDYKKCF